VGVEANYLGRCPRPRFAAAAQVEHKTRITGGFATKTGWGYRTVAQMAFDREQQIHVPFSLLSAVYD
jgi:hypothetical protein